MGLNSLLFSLLLMIAGHALAQDQKESKVACPHKHIPKIPVPLTGTYYMVCNRYSRFCTQTCL